jgi:hypothetical protein
MLRTERLRSAHKPEAFVFLSRGGSRGFFVDHVNVPSQSIARIVSELEARCKVLRRTTPLV